MSKEKQFKKMTHFVQIFDVSLLSLSELLDYAIEIYVPNFENKLNFKKILWQFILN